MAQESSGTWLAASGDNCATWQAVAPWQERSLPYVCKSFHNSSASFLFDIVSGGSRHLVCTVKGQCPSTSEIPYLPLLYSLSPHSPAICPFVQRMNLKYVGSGRVSEGSQSELSPRVFTTCWLFDFDVLKGIHGCLDL